MGVSGGFHRLTSYYSRHGLIPTFRRASVAAKRTILSSRMVVFRCDLARDHEPPNLPQSLTVERLDRLAELHASDLQELTGFWNPRIANERIKERLEKGASLTNLSARREALHIE